MFMIMSHMVSVRPEGSPSIGRCMDAPKKLSTVNSKISQNTPIPKENTNKQADNGHVPLLIHHGKDRLRQENQLQCVCYSSVRTSAPHPASHETCQSPT